MEISAATVACKQESLDRESNFSIHGDRRARSMHPTNQMRDQSMGENSFAFVCVILVFALLS